MTELIADVFKTIGQPTITYIKRDSGRLEKSLRDALNEHGQLCLITGPSKTGKTTLYKEVLNSRGEIPLVVQCDRTQTTGGIWKNALESVNFDRTNSITTGRATEGTAELEAGGKLGWAWLAEAAGRAKLSGKKGQNEATIREKILADPGPDLLIPLLKQTPYVLVVEDFHYLPDSEKVTLFQQWKRFIDNEVSVLVLGTTHRAVDIANSNKDLIGRISQIDVGHWSAADLQSICTKGFEYLHGTISGSLKQLIGEEAVGLPIIVQQTCQSIFTSKDIETTTQARRKKIKATPDDVNSALHAVAKQKYTQFENHYNTLISGPREKARKYRTYELVLACFTLDPIKFSLKRMEIDKRLTTLNLGAKETPPAASLNSTLGALKSFQEKRGFELLEWIPKEDILYIIEPAFLFYVRWRRMKETAPVQLDLFEELLFSLSSKAIWNVARAAELESIKTLQLVTTRHMHIHHKKI